MSPFRPTIPRCCWPIVLLAIWPYLFLFPYTFNLIGVGNDFHYLYYVYKHHLLSMVHGGVFPLWSPTEEGGFPFFSNPFAQAFYPLNALYYLYFVLFGKFGPWDYTLFTILALSIFDVGLYLWLRELGVRAGVALAAALCAVISLKATELLRFPNAVHAAAWLPWMLLGLTLATRLRHRWLGSAVFGGGLLMLLTAGYPYFIIYAVFLLLPYAASMLAAPARAALGLDPAEECCGRIRYLGRITAPAIIAGILASPLLLNMQALMAMTVDRGTPNFNYATGYLFGWRETIGAWVFPPVSSMEGWYYFGMLTTLLVGHQFLAAITARSDYVKDRPLVLLVWPWLATVIYFTWGRDSVLFTWVWHHAPVLNQMRVWGRMNVILIPVITLLLARAIQRLCEKPPPAPHLARIGVIGVFVPLWLTIIGTQIYLLREGRYDGYWPLYFKGLPGGKDQLFEFPYYLTHGYDESRFVWSGLGLGVLLLLLLFYRHSRAEPGPLFRWFPAALVALTTAELAVLSIFQWFVPAGKLDQGRYDSLALLKSEWSAPRSLFAGEIMSDRLMLGHQKPQYGVGIIPNWGMQGHANIYGKYIGPDAGGYARAWRPDASEQVRQAVARFYGAEPYSDRLFFSQSIEHQGIPEFLNDVDQFLQKSRTSVKTLEYDGNHLRLAVSTEQAAWLTFVDNWDPNWTARINGATASIALCLGSYKAVLVPAGASEVLFDYQPHFWPSKLATPPSP